MPYLNTLVELLIDNPLLMLFVILGLGHVIGQIRVGSFSLGVSAILFVGLGISALHPDLVLPEIIYQFGLLLFVYTIGLASGPDYFASFRRHGLRDNLMGITLLIVAGVLTYALARILRFDPATAAGLYAGSLTNTPALAGVVEALKEYGSNLAGSVDINTLLAQPVIGYSLTYPVGVVGVILVIHFFSYLWRIDFAHEHKKHDEDTQQHQNQPSQCTSMPANRIGATGSTIHQLADINLPATSLGIIIGLLVGLTTIPLPGGLSFRLGFAGGPLLVALLLGYLGHTGPLQWRMPQGANLTLRHLGITLFLAGIGSRAGYAFASTLQELGPTVVIAGAIVTITHSSLVLIIGYKLLRIPMSVLSGLLSGLQTQPAALVYATEKSGSDLPNIGYATVYPTAMVAKIILAQILLNIMM